MFQNKVKQNRFALDKPTLKDTYMWSEMSRSTAIQVREHKQEQQIRSRICPSE